MATKNVNVLALLQQARAKKPDPNFAKKHGPMGKVSGGEVQLFISELEGTAPAPAPAASKSAAPPAAKKAPATTTTTKPVVKNPLKK